MCPLPRTLLLLALAACCGASALKGADDDFGSADSSSGTAQLAAAPVVSGSLNPGRHGLNLPRNAKVMLVPVNDHESTKYGMIDEWQANFIERRLRHAEDEKYDLVILQIDTNGGSVGACEQINKAIANCKVPVVAFVDGKAFSGGALVALGTKMIVMSSNSQIGGAKVVTLWGSDLPASMKEKADSMMRAMVANLARINHYPEPIAIGMVNSDVEIYEISDPVERFVTDERLADLERSRGGKPDIIHQWKKSGTILTLTSVEAVNAGLAAGIVDSPEDICTGLGIQPASIDTAGVTPSEIVARAVSNPVWRVLLLIIGVIGLFWEMKAPGHGVGYFVFAFCLGIFFWLQIFSNSAGLWEVALFGLGALLVALELFLIPGFGLAGFIGFALILVSIVLSFVPEGVTWAMLFTNGNGDGGVADWNRQRAIRALLWAAISLVSLCVVVITALAKGVTLPGLKRLALNAEVDGTFNASAQPALVSPPPAMLGKTGVAETVLRPAGKVRLEGVTYDAISEGSHIEAGKAVTVLSQRGASLVVRAL